MSIASAITAAQQKVAAAYTACNSKGATMPAAGSQNLSNLPATINSISTGGGGDTYPTEDADFNDVQFIGHDGIIIASMSAEDFLALGDYPTLPCPQGLVHDGWNWPLATAKAYVTKYGKLDVGRLYNTIDGKTRIYVHHKGVGLSPILKIKQTVSNGTTVDWGDGSEPTTISGTGNVSATHTYASTEKFKNHVITLSVTSGTISLGYGSNGNPLLNFSAAYIYGINIGSNVTALENYCFYQKNALQYVSFPSTLRTIGTYCFTDCLRISAVIIPNGMTALTNICNPGTSVVNNCKHVVLSPTVTSLTNSSFRRMWLNGRIIFPDGMTTTSSAFDSNNGVAEIVLPESITTITARAFYDGYGVSDIYSFPTTPPTIANANAFTNVSTAAVIHVPAGSLAAYQGATNWSGRASQMVGDL